MEAHRVTIYPAEWWHFDYETWDEYPILNLTLEELVGGSPQGEAGAIGKVRHAIC